MPTYPFDIIVLDLETAGAPDHRIVEIGAVRLIRGTEPADQFRSFVNGSPVSEEVVKVHGITEETLAGAPDWGEVYGGWVEWCRKSPAYVLMPFGAYFDVPVLRAEYARWGLRYPHPGQCLDVRTVVWREVIRRGFPARYLSVERACEILGVVPSVPRHRALPDAMTEAMLFLEADK